MPATTMHDPVLVIGGSGVVGRQALTALRTLQPSLAIAIGARDTARAERLAHQLGNAQAETVDLARADLGLAGDRRYSAVVALLKDERLHTLRYAQQHALPYVAFSEFAFDLAPLVAFYAERPDRSAILNLSGTFGGTGALAALHFARELRQVEAIRIGALIDQDDVGGPAAQSDPARVAAAVPRPLVRTGGAFVWADGERARRVLRDRHGRALQGEALSLVDAASLAAATGARSVRVDLAVRSGDARNAGQGPRTEVLIELDGTLHGGCQGTRRGALVDRRGHAFLSGFGVALGVERLLGLRGGPAPGPGLYGPETLLDPADALARLQQAGVELVRLAA